MSTFEYNIPIASVIDAYKKGLFPMAETFSSNEIYWIEPKNRGVFFFDQIKIPKSFKKFLKTEVFDISVDSRFIELIDSFFLFSSLTNFPDFSEIAQLSFNAHFL